MKKSLMFLAVLGALFGTQAALATPSTEKPCIDLGVAPYGEDTPKSREIAGKILGLTTDMMNQVRSQAPQKVVIDERWLLAKMISAGGKVLQNKRVCGSEKADLYTIDNGQGGKIVLVRPEKCNNWSILAAGQILRFPPVSVPVSPPLVLSPPASVSPPTAAVPPGVPGIPTPATGGEKSASILVDGIAQEKWLNTKTSHNRSAFAEVMVWNGDVGAGIIGTHNEGHSVRNGSKWDIDFLGVQIGVKGKEPFVTEDGRNESVLWQAKGRLGVEHLDTIDSKGRDDRHQRTILAGAYVERLKTDGKCMYGWVAGAWVPVGASVNSGKSIEDRTSLFAHIRRECQVDDKWSWRVDGGPEWSAVNGTAFSVAGQLRYRTENDITFFVGPQLGYNFTSGTWFWAGFVGVQLGGIDVGVLHKKYVEDHQVVPTGRMGAEVFAPDVPVATVQAPVATTTAARTTSTKIDDRQGLEEMWASLKKK